jgi:hypothetical protein
MIVDYNKDAQIAKLTYLIKTNAFLTMIDINI